MINKIKNIIIFLFSLETPKSRLSMIFFCMFVLIFLPFEYLYILPIFSVYSKIGLYDFLGFEFYSSGMTRALSSIFHLNFKNALEYNPLAFIFVLGLFIFIVLDFYRLIFKNNTNKLN